MIPYTQEDLYQLFLSMIKANASVSGIQWWLDVRARDLLNAEGNEIYNDIDSIPRESVEKYFSPSHMNSVERMHDLHQIILPQEIRDIFYETSSNELPSHLNALAANIHNQIFKNIIISWRLLIGK